MEEFSVNFINHGKVIRVASGTDILSAAVKCGIFLNAACGGEGLCGKCAVIVKSGRVKTGPTHLIDGPRQKRGFVLACSTLVEGDLEIEVPEESRASHGRISHDSEEFVKGEYLYRQRVFKRSPLVRKVYLELKEADGLEEPSGIDRISVRLEKETKGLFVSANLENIKNLEKILRDSDFKITVTLGYRDDREEILSLEPGNRTGANYGFAFDIGTTTITGQLVDLNTGDILGARIAFNKQAFYGSDVITRIIYAALPDGLERLGEAVVENMDEIMEELASANHISLSDANAMACAGNTTMMHLLLGIDPSSIRKAPYVPPSTAFPATHPSKFGLEMNPKGLVSFLPCVSSYVGGDTVAGVLACGLDDAKELSILVDIGTNGEVVLGNNEWMVAAAASAGPAFEGSGLECGMKAVKGAIDKVYIGKRYDVELETIGGEAPRGICGSGYIDLLSHLKKNSLIDRSGRFNRGAGCDRIRAREDGYEFVVIRAREEAAERDIVITEDDIENLKRAKGAIYSAIITLLNKVSKDLSEVRRLYIAGGFGNYLNMENAIYIGLLPDIDRSLYEFVGNSSLAGAKMSLVSHEAFMRTRDISKSITYIDLSSETGYMDEYIASLFFPHTDLGRFPSAR